MKGFNLSQEERSALRAAHKAKKNKRAAYKINAVILLGSGWTLKKVKLALLLDDETLRSYVEKYRTGGVDALLKTNHKGRDSLLTEPQTNVLAAELESTIHLTTQSVIEYVTNEFNIQYSMSGMRDLLHRLGYEYKKPKLVPGTPNVDAQEEFVKFYENFMLKKPSDYDGSLWLDKTWPKERA